MKFETQTEYQCKLGTYEIINELVPPVVSKSHNRNKPLFYCFTYPLLIYNLIFEKSIWKNQVQQTGFLACKNQDRN